MDKQQKQTREDEEIAAFKRYRNIVNRLKVRCDPLKLKDNREALALLETIYSARRDELEKLSKKFLADKKSLSIFTYATEVEHRMLINDNTVMYALDYLENRLANLENIVQGIIKLNLSNMEERIQKLQETLNQPDLTEVANFIHDIKKSVEDAKKAQELYVH